MTEAPNIVWLTLDSVRVDHTNMGGYERDTTPRLQTIADDPDGDWYENCFAHSNSTRISTASIVTGTYPSHHGVRGDRTIPSSLKTVPEILSDRGYRTIAISRNANSSMGFDRGFDEFSWISSDRFFESVDYRTAIKYAFNIRRHSAGLSRDTAKHATPFIVNDMAKRRMRAAASRDEPFFMYLHYNEPHRPYYPPVPWLDTFTDEIAFSTEEAAEFAMDMHYNAHEYIANGLDFTDDEWDALIAMYDAEIAYTDECVGRLFQYANSLDLGKTVFVVTADHGELFGEHDLLTHKIVLHDDLINVPLVVHGLSGLGCDTGDLLQHADLMQTFVTMAGGDTSQFQGVDLHSDSREFVIAQDWEQNEALDDILSYNSAFDDSRYHRPLLTCLRDHTHKFQRSDEGSELFELPDEETDISEDQPEKAAELAAYLDEWISEYGQPVSTDTEREEFSDAMKRQLSELGYLVE